uniref:Uncharacterized protein n=1 Tax=Physcomitrium patens TaxID=3218 RepID=A0A2K1KVH6_PHYPA|nr:hypothetical protein PHYPA_004778 [Physcomitrium patens]
MPNAASMAVSDGSSGGRRLSMVILSGGRRWKSERGAVEKVAVWLRKKLGLTIIGFDIMDVSDMEPIPAFWIALRNAHTSMSAST